LKTLIFVFLTNSLLSKVSLPNSLFDFCFCKKVILKNFANFLYLQTYFWGGYATLTRRCVTGKEGGIKVLVGLAQFCQNVGSLLRTPWPTKLAKNLHNMSLVISHCKNTLNYFWSNTLK